MRDIVVFCAEAFGGWGGATQRFIQMATGLAKYGWRTTIVRSRKTSLDDEVEKAFPGKVVTTPLPTDPYPPFFDFYGMRLLYRKGCALIGKQGIFDPRKGWPEHVISPHYSGLFDFPVDVVLGVSFGHVRSLYAAKSFAKKNNRPFLLEFQDPCPQPHKRLYDIQQVRLEECMRDCHGIITTSVSYANLLREKYPAHAGKVFPLYLSYDDSSESTVSSENPDQKVTFLHAGTLYGKGERNADGFLYGLKKAVDIDPGIRDKSCFRIIGGGKGARRAGKLAQRLGIRPLVDIRDSVSYSQSIVTMNAADVLIVIKYPDPAYSFQIPGKTFQYFGRRKPILGIMGTCEAADLIKNSGLGTIVGHDRIDEIASYILRYVNNRTLLKDDFRPNQGFIEEFSVSSMAHRLDNYLGDILGAFTNCSLCQ